MTFINRRMAVCLGKNCGIMSGKPSSTSLTTRSIIAPKLIPVGDVLYSLAGPESGVDNVGIFRLSADSDMLIPVQGVPILIVENWQ